MIIDDIRKIKSGKKESREFGLVVGGVLLALGAIALWRGKPIYPYLISCGAVLMSLGLLAPAILAPLNKVWMALAIVIGFFMSRLVLTILFYLVITPIGIIMRALGKDLLDQRIERERPSYWKDRPAGEKTKESYEKQY